MVPKDDIRKTAAWKAPAHDERLIRSQLIARLQVGIVDGRVADLGVTFFISRVVEFVDDI